MRWISVYILMAFQLFASGKPFPQPMDSLIHRGIGQSLSDQFDAALETFEQLEARCPKHPVGPYYMAATLQSKMMRYETDRWEPRFFELSDTTLARSEKWLKQYGDKPWIYFFQGSLRSNLGLYQAKRGHVVKGFVIAEKGVDDLMRAVMLDSSLYDAYLGIGNYKYWSGKFYRYIRWLPFIRDERKLGLAELKLGMEKGCFSYWLGVNSLAWLEYDIQNYQEAIRLFELGAAEFDSSLIWLWGLADTHKEAKHYETALHYYQYIVRTVKNDPLESGYNEVLARWKIILCLDALERYDELIIQEKAMRNRPVEACMLSKAIDRRAKAEKLRKKAEKKILRNR